MLKKIPVNIDFSHMLLRENAFLKATCLVFVFFVLFFLVCYLASAGFFLVRSQYRLSIKPTQAQ
jgi:Na+-transporting methylmalonyl-CoA/oxaloacetate decarboxylase gamma subunit